jgi:hypothetical protein
MVTEYIKRNQKMGFDENGVLLYKIPADAEAPVLVEEEEAPAEDFLFDPLLGDD